MASIYVRWIRAGRMALREVPERWRAEVAAVLDGLEGGADNGA